MKTNSYESKVRRPAVAGQFYPAEKKKLIKFINSSLKKVKSREAQCDAKALIVPHAGFDYSGQVAAYGYREIQGRKYENIILIGNSHTAYFPGVAVDDSDEWETPLGTVEINKQLAEKFVNFGRYTNFKSSVHTKEHSLEIQLPWLQTILPDGFKIVPLLFGNQDEEAFAELAVILEEHLGENDLIIVSSDMSHYPSYDDANRIDKTTLDIIKENNNEKLVEYFNETMNSGIAGEQTILCGIDAVKTLMFLRNLKDWGVQVLNYRNSGDINNGNKFQVVGYGAVVYCRGDRHKNVVKENLASNILSQEQKDKLLNIAKRTVESFVKHAAIPDFQVSDSRLNQEEGAFVSLYENNELRGCIGQIMPSTKPLWQIVRDMAVAACSEDHRFWPIKKDELPDLKYEISVLSAPQRVGSYKEIQLGKHGVIIKKGNRSGVFLPQVAAETGWEIEEFLGQLCHQKAGLSPSCYLDSDIELYVFTAQIFRGA